MSHPFERAFYENPYIWVPERYAGIDEERVQVAIQWLPDNARSVLDLGCGNGILANRLQNTRQVVGLDRSLAALEWVQTARCQGDIAFLPFQDDAFDAVVAMEVMEHLPFPVFRRALAEIARVTRRYVLASVPYQEDREGLQINCPHCGCRFHPDQHVRSFEHKDMQHLFGAGDVLSPVRASGVVPVKDYRFPQLRKALSRVLGRKRRFPWHALCPQCGYSRDESLTQATARSEQETIRPWRQWLRRIWPKETRYTWWMALYEKK